jgi:hypothetical protein
LDYYVAGQITTESDSFDVVKKLDAGCDVIFGKDANARREMGRNQLNILEGPRLLSPGKLP